MLAFLGRAFAASLIMTGIHAYLGVHVVERGVIFVDLSLAQIAALGATIALLLTVFERRSARARTSTGSASLFTFIGRRGVSTHSRRGAHAFRRKPSSASAMPWPRPRRFSR